VARTLTILGGDGTDYVDIHALSDNVTVGGATTINLGTGGDQDLEVYASNGYDIDFIGPVVVKAASDYVEVDVDSNDNGSDITFFGKTVIDLAKTDGSNVEVENYGDGDIVFNGLVDVIGGAGDDYVHVYTGGGGDVIFNGAVRLNGKGGLNEVYIDEVNDVIEFNGGFSQKNFIYI
jgi:hypothetical protein